MKLSVKRHAVVQPPDPSYRLIPLTQGQNAIVDAEDFEWLSQWNWFAHWNPGTQSFYAERCKERPPFQTSMHRAILRCKEEEECDHWNHDTLDNRKKNLRKCTSLENGRNKRKQRINTSGFKGVTCLREVGKWSAKIRVNGKLLYIGVYQSAKDAARAYDEAAKIHYGEFAHFNLPQTATTTPAGRGSVSKVNPSN